MMWAIASAGLRTGDDALKDLTVQRVRATARGGMQMVLLSEVNASLARLSCSCLSLCCQLRRSRFSCCAGVSLQPVALVAFFAFC